MPPLALTCDLHGWPVIIAAQSCPAPSLDRESKSMSSAWISPEMFLLSQCGDLVLQWFLCQNQCRSCHVVSSQTRDMGAWGVRYTSVASLETLGLAYKQATELVGHYYDAFHNETRLATNPTALAEEKAGVEALEKDLLINKVAQPLSEPTHYLLISLLQVDTGSRPARHVNHKHIHMSAGQASRTLTCMHACMPAVCSAGVQKKDGGHNVHVTELFKERMGKFGRMYAMCFPSAYPFTETAMVWLPV